MPQISSGLLVHLAHLSGYGENMKRILNFRSKCRKKQVINYLELEDLKLKGFRSKVILQMLCSPSGTGCQTPKCRWHFMNSSFWWQLKPFSTFLSNTSLLILITKSSFPTIPPYPSPHSPSLPQPSLHSPSLILLLTVPTSSLSSQSHSPSLISLLTVSQSLPPSSLSSQSHPHPSHHCPSLILLLIVPPSSLSSQSHSPSLIPFLTVPPSLIPLLTVPPSSFYSQSLPHPSPHSRTVPPSSLSSQSHPHPSPHSPSLILLLTVPPSFLSSQSHSPSLISLLIVPPSSLSSQSLPHPSPHSSFLIPSYPSSLSPSSSPSAMSMWLSPALYKWTSALTLSSLLRKKGH